MSEPYCPQCPHGREDHGTYGCLFGWHWGADGRLAQGCTCVGMRLVDHTRSLPVFGLPYSAGAGSSPSAGSVPPAPPPDAR